MSELARLRDRVAQLEQALGVNRSLTGRLRAVFGIEPTQASILGMLLKRNFVTTESLYTVLYGDRPDCDLPDPQVLAVQILLLIVRSQKKGNPKKPRRSITAPASSGPVNHRRNVSWL
jgi:hypothetical protein